MNSGIIIRPAMPEDRPAIERLYRDLEGPYAGQNAQGSVPLWEEQWDKGGAGRWQKLLVAERQGRIIGSVTVILFPDLIEGTFAAVENLIVAEDARGCGLGGAFLTKAEELARQDGAGRIMLTTNLARSSAHAFYRRLGWQETLAGFLPDRPGETEK